jgi:hypothetical protein
VARGALCRGDRERPVGGSTRAFGSSLEVPWRDPAEDPRYQSGTAVTGGRFIVKFAWSGTAARGVAREIGVVTALARGALVPFLPEAVASSTSPVLLVTRVRL